MEPINGKTYTLWGQFVDRKEEWIGGTMLEHDAQCGDHTDTIKDISMRPNGTKSAMFVVTGEGYEWCCDVEILSVSPSNQRDGKSITLGSRFGDTLTITKPCKTEN